MRLTNLILLIFVWCGLCNAYNGYYTSDTFEDQEYWKRLGREEIETAVRRPVNWNHAKNVIILVAVGMDPNTVTASRIYQEKEKGKLSFERFPHMGLLKTYSANKKVPDAAATGTALFTGVKTNNEMIGVDSRVKQGDCQSSVSPHSRLSSIMKWAQDAGKHTGFVTNKRVTEPVSSALYAHAASRFWECNLADNYYCKDIASQLIEDEPGRNFKVIFGGGRQCLMTNAPITQSDKVDVLTCSRTDNKNLIEQWQSDKSMKNVKYQYIRNTGDLIELDIARTEYALGIFANSHMPFESNRNTSIQGEPSLELMVEPAIKMLRKERNGFVLMVEAGLIDKAHHEGHARKAIEETIEFDKTVKKTLEILNDLGIINETLVIVTGGHGHTMSINGYPARNESILGIAERSKHDNVPYTTLTYATGTTVNFQYKGDGYHVARQDPTKDDILSRNYAHQAAILTDKETHGGGDVTVYAIGPMAHLFHSIHEESYVAHVIGYAAKIGPYRNAALNTYPTVFVFVLSTISAIQKII